MIQNRRMYGAGGRVLVGIFIVFFLAASAGAQDSSISITFPIGNEVWTIGEYKYITWEYSGMSRSDAVKLQLVSHQGGGSRIIGTITNGHNIGSRGHGRYRWKVGYYQGGTAEPGKYSLTITTVTGRVCSDGSSWFDLRRSGGGLSTTPSGAGTLSRGPQPQAGPQPQTQAGPQPQTGASRLRRHPSPPRATGDPDFKIADAYYDRITSRLVAVVENQRATSMASYRGPLKIAWKRGSRQKQYTEVPYIILGHGQSKDIALTTFSWPPDTGGLSFEIEVDPENEVTETREYNNSSRQTVYRSATPDLVLKQGKIQIVGSGGGTKDLSDGGTVILDRSDIDTVLDRECEHTFAIKVQFRLINCGAQRADMRVAIFFGDNGRRGRESVEVSLNPGHSEKYTKTITLKDPSTDSFDVRVYRVGSADSPSPKDLLNGHMRCSSSLVDYIGRPAKLRLGDCRVIDESGGVAGMTPRHVTLDWPGNLTLRAKVTNSPYYGPVRSPWKLFFKVECQHVSEVPETPVDTFWDYNNTPGPGAEVTRTYEFRPPKPYESCTFKVRIESTSCPTMIQGDYEKEIHFDLD
jgi:hypothetical protein